MPSVKISQLPAGSVLAGSELVPAVQAGATVQTTVAALRAGLATSGHGHTIADTGGLQAALNGKAAIDLSNVPDSTFAGKAAAAGVGGGGTTALSSAAPAALGTAAAGTAATAARADHVHPIPTAAAVGAAPAVHTHAIGDTAGLQAALDGKLAQGRHTLSIPARAWVGRQTGGAAPGSFETPTNRVLVPVLDFDAATQEAAQTGFEWPKSGNPAAGIVAQVAWTAAGGSGGVAWGLRAQWLRDDDPLDAAWGTAVVVTDTLTAANRRHVTAASAAITPAGAHAAGAWLALEVYREIAHAADTLAVDARLISVRLLITLNAGSDD